MLCLVALAVPGGTDLPPKKRIDAKKKLSKAIEKRFPEARLFPLNTEQESSLLLRHLSTQKQRHLAFRDRRAHLLAHTAEFVPAQEGDLVGTLKVSGFVRGQSLNVNSLVHIVGHGDFQMSQVDAPPDPLSLNPRVVKGQKRSQDMEVQVCWRSGRCWLCLEHGVQNLHQENTTGCMCSRGGERKLY